MYTSLPLNVSEQEMADEAEVPEKRRGRRRRDDGSPSRSRSRARHSEEASGHGRDTENGDDRERRRRRREHSRDPSAARGEENREERRSRSRRRREGEESQERGRHRSSKRREEEDSRESKEAEPTVDDGEQEDRRRSRSRRRREEGGEKHSGRSHSGEQNLRRRGRDRTRSRDPEGRGQSRDGEDGEGRRGRRRKPDHEEEEEVQEGHGEDLAADKNAGDSRGTREERRRRRHAQRERIESKPLEPTVDDDIRRLREKREAEKIEKEKKNSVDFIGRYLTPADTGADSASVTGSQQGSQQDYDSQVDLQDMRDLRSPSKMSGGAEYDMIASSDVMTDTGIEELEEGMRALDTIPEEADKVKKKNGGFVTKYFESRISGMFSRKKVREHHKSKSTEDAEEEAEKIVMGKKSNYERIVDFCAEAIATFTFFCEGITFGMVCVNFVMCYLWASNYKQLLHFHSPISLAYAYLFNIFNVVAFAGSIDRFFKNQMMNWRNKSRWYVAVDVAMIVLYFLAMFLSYVNLPMDEQLFYQNHRVPYYWNNSTYGLHAGWEYRIRVWASLDIMRSLCFGTAFLLSLITLRPFDSSPDDTSFFTAVLEHRNKKHKDRVMSNMPLLQEPPDTVSRKMATRIDELELAGQAYKFPAQRTRIRTKSISRKALQESTREARETERVPRESISPMMTSGGAGRLPRLPQSPLRSLDEERPHDES